MLCRIIIDPPAPGAWNMAVDEALLESAAAGGGMSLRFYGWREPTLTLGYFQQYGDRRQHAASRACPAVRRITGGGAILHDREITYSLVVPPGHALAIRHLELYENIHAALIAVLADYDLSATLWRGEGRESDHKPTFLCFQRRAPGDVLLGDNKIAGSAQRRWRGAVLQHGSVLLARSPAAPELAGVAEAAAKRLSFDQLAEAWSDQLAHRLSVNGRPGTISDREHQRAAELVREKYGFIAWTEHRARAYADNIKEQ